MNIKTQQQQANRQEHSSRSPERMKKRMLPSSSSSSSSCLLFHHKSIIIIVVLVVFLVVSIVDAATITLLDTQQRFLATQTPRIASRYTTTRHLWYKYSGVLYEAHLQYLPQNINLCYKAIENKSDYDLYHINHIVVPNDGRPVALLIHSKEDNNNNNNNKYDNKNFTATIDDTTDANNTKDEEEEDDCSVEEKVDYAAKMLHPRGIVQYLILPDRYFVWIQDELSSSTNEDDALVAALPLTTPGGGDDQPRMDQTATITTTTTTRNTTTATASLSSTNHKADKNSYSSIHRSLALQEIQQNQNPVNHEQQQQQQHDVESITTTSTKTNNDVSTTALRYSSSPLYVLHVSYSTQRVLFDYLEHQYYNNNNSSSNNLTAAVDPSGPLISIDARSPFPDPQIIWLLVASILVTGLTCCCLRCLSSLDRDLDDDNNTNNNHHLTNHSAGFLFQPVFSENIFDDVVDTTISDSAQAAVGRDTHFPVPAEDPLGTAAAVAAITPPATTTTTQRKQEQQIDDNNETTNSLTEPLLPNTRENVDDYETTQSREDGYRA